MQVQVTVGQKVYVLSDDHQVDGAAVLISPDGKHHGPWDNVIENHDARMASGEAYHWQMTARAIASFIRDDRRDGAVAMALLKKFEAVPDPSLPPN